MVIEDCDFFDVEQSEQNKGNDLGFFYLFIYYIFYFGCIYCYLALLKVFA